MNKPRTYRFRLKLEGLIIFSFVLLMLLQSCSIHNEELDFSSLSQLDLKYEIQQNGRKTIVDFYPSEDALKIQTWFSIIPDYVVYNCGVNIKKGLTDTIELNMRFRQDSSVYNLHFLQGVLVTKESVSALDSSGNRNTPEYEISEYLLKNYTFKELVDYNFTLNVIAQYLNKGKKDENVFLPTNELDFFALARSTYYSQGKEAYEKLCQRLKAVDAYSYGNPRFKLYSRDKHLKLYKKCNCGDEFPEYEPIEN